MHVRRLWILAAIFGAACTPDAPTTTDDDLRVCPGHPSSLRGIDVSRYQGTIDWNAVRAAGVTFAFARVADGMNTQDKEFAGNWEGMRHAGIRRGAYFFFRPGRSAEDQADKMVAAIGKLASSDLPPVLDLEVSDGQSDAVVVRKAITWLERVKVATGRTPLLYSGSGFINTLSDPTPLKGYPLWIANFGASCPSLPKGFTRWVIWQKSDRGQVPGVHARVDQDIFPGQSADLDRFVANGS